MFPEIYSTGCLLGCVTVVDVLTQEEYKKSYPDGENDSPYVFICENSFMLPIKFPIQGKHKICKYFFSFNYIIIYSLLRLIFIIFIVIYR